MILPLCLFFRSPRYDDKKRVAQWKAHQLSDKALVLSNLDSGPVSDSITNPISISVTMSDDVSRRSDEEGTRPPRITFTAFDRIDGRKRSLIDNEDDHDNDHLHDHGSNCLLPTTTMIRPVVVSSNREEHDNNNSNSSIVSAQL